MPHADLGRQSRILRGAAALFGTIGLAILVWLGDKAIRYPQIHASQLGAEAPLWIPMMIFVAICTAASVALFLRAARRVDQGEDLFNNRRIRNRPPS